MYENLTQGGEACALLGPGVRQGLRDQSCQGEPGRLAPLKDHLDQVRREIGERQQLGGVQDTGLVGVVARVDLMRDALSPLFGRTGAWRSFTRSPASVRVRLRRGRHAAQIPIAPSTLRGSGIELSKTPASEW